MILMETASSLEQLYQEKKNGMTARLQHLVVETDEIEAMIKFYHHGLGFSVTDRVEDEEGVLRACF